MIDEERLQEVWITDNKGRRWPIIAEIYDGLAIHHEALIYDDGVNFLTSKQWTITHVQSGVALSTCENEEQARKRLAKCLVVRWHGLALGELPICEICANALAIAALVKIRLSYDEILQRASFAAELLACTPKSEE